MNEQEAAVEQALRDVWLRHRDSVIADLRELVDSIETWNSGTRHDVLASDIRRRAHRILGSLTMVGRNGGASDLRTIEERSVHEIGPYAKEVVERVHDLRRNLEVDT